MRLSTYSILFAAFAVAGLTSLVAASFAVTLIEENSEYGVRDAFDENGLTWAEVDSDGLRVILTGTAPSEARRFQAISTAGRIVDAARLIDKMEIEATKGIAPPRFSVEILRNDSGISLIGLIPAKTDREALLTKLESLVEEGTLTDLLESADYPVPDGWDAALEYGLSSLKSLPRSKISIDAKRVEITAISGSADAKRSLEAALSKSTPHDLKVELDISAPRPVITPFALRFLIDEDGARFDSCAADTVAARTQILAAARAAGVDGQVNCTIGLGVPSTTWAKAAELAIGAVKQLGGGAVTFSDADISLVAVEGADQATFDNVVGVLENQLPDVFALHAVLPKKPDANDQGPPEFVATLSPEGLLQMRGRVSDELTRQAVTSFSRARFGSATVHSSARIDGDLPSDWPVRLLAALDALAHLSNGAATVLPDVITVSGNTGDQDASAKIASLLAKKLGEGARYEINVNYQKKLDPIAGIPTPDECEEQIAKLQEARKIAFEPGSDTVTADTLPTIEAIGELLKKCGAIKIEIGGHTDSQGRETMNLALSQSRAQAVLNELRQRRILTSTYSAKGYGETQPIDDNKTEDGREANRRIEFRLIRPKPIEETETTLENSEQPAAHAHEETKTDE